MFKYEFDQPLRSKFVLPSSHDLDVMKTLFRLMFRELTWIIYRADLCFFFFRRIQTKTAD